MQIKTSIRFDIELNEILDYIGADSPQNALKFAKDLNLKINKLTNYPFKFKQSSKSDDKNVRELIFKKYVIPYRVNIKQNQIEILGVFHQNEWEL